MCQPMSALSPLILLHLHTSSVWSGVEYFRWSISVTFTHISFISRGARRSFGTRVYNGFSTILSQTAHTAITGTRGRNNELTRKMSRSMAVTRTFSMGNCSGSSRVSGPQDIQGARRHSLVGMRAHMWANSSRSLGWERVTSKDNILSNVVTPSSIPQFTIPRLAVEDSMRCTGHERERSGKEDDAETKWGSLDEPEYYVNMSSSLSSSSSSSSYSSSTSSGLGSSPAMSRKACRSISDPESLKGAFMQQRTSNGAQQLYDPASCAALSLPHLPKVTTPYGFVTLSQSPQMASEEALLFQAGLSRRKGRLDEESTSTQQRHLRPEQSKALSSSQSLPPAFSSTHMPPAPTSLQRSEIQRAKGGTSAGPDNSDSSRVSGSKPKCRFWGVLRKHFVSQKCLQRQNNV